MAKRSQSRSTTSNEAGVAPDAKRPARGSPSSPRYPSPLPSGCSLPLTQEHLNAVPDYSLQYCTGAPSHTGEESVSDMAGRPGSPTRNNWDDRKKLAAYKIEVDSDHALPEDLGSFFDKVLCKDIPGPRSPNAKKIFDLRKQAALENEPGANRLLEPWLLATEAPQPHNASSKLNHNLSREFLPHAPSDLVKNAYGSLSQPQPDTATGYLTRTEAEASNPAQPSLFSLEEEAMLDEFKFTLNPSLGFPFLTSQWKPATGESHQKAMCQSARDGATIVNYLHDFYRTAYGRPATPLEALHISLSCNVDVACLWAHWRHDWEANGTPTYYMKVLQTTTIWDKPALLRIRTIIKNWTAYALEERVKSIKGALPMFHKNKRQAKGAKTPVNPSSRSASSSIRPPKQLRPPTPRSSDRQPSKQTSAGAQPRKKHKSEQDGYESLDELSIPC